MKSTIVIKLLQLTLYTYVLNFHTGFFNFIVNTFARPWSSLNIYRTGRRVPWNTLHQPNQSRHTPFLVAICITCKIPWNTLHPPNHSHRTPMYNMYIEFLWKNSIHPTIPSSHNVCIYKICTYIHYTYI